jgi:hypothetical protein
MNMDLNEIKKIIDAVFSKDGYKVNSFGISCPSLLDVSVKKTDDNVDIDFGNNLPVATIQKFITFAVRVRGINFGATGGTIKLKFFPDIPFNYSNSSSSYSSLKFINYDDLNQEIEEKYGDDDRQKIAKKCLQYAQEWTNIASSNGTLASECSPVERAELRKQCKAFVKDNMRNDEDTKYGSAILGVIILSFILPVIINWIVTKVLNKWWGN